MSGDQIMPLYATLGAVLVALWAMLSAAVVRRVGCALGFVLSVTLVPLALGVLVWVVGVGIATVVVYTRGAHS